MSTPPYVELHAHSAFSFHDGASTPLELAGAAAALGYPALALTDHDGIWGSMEFAQACRAIGEPIFGRPLADISFARVLGQLFRLAETFDMAVQPQLLLLQKNTLMAEGVSRQLHPGLNIWTLAQPLIEQWMIENRGPQARIEQATRELMHAAERLPSVMRNIDRLVSQLAEGGLKLDPEAIKVINRTGSNWWLWIIIAVLAAGLLFTR